MVSYDLYYVRNRLLYCVFSKPYKAMLVSSLLTAPEVKGSHPQQQQQQYNM